MLRISDLVDLLHARRDPWKALALLKAFFDESGVHCASEITGVAGFVGPAENWTRIESEWEAELCRLEKEWGKVDVFHATDCENGTGIWCGLAREIRDIFSVRLATIIAAQPLVHGIWAAVETAAWQRRATPHFLERYGTPYAFCAEWCFQRLSNWSKDHADGAPVALVFAEHQQFGSRIAEVFGFYMANKRWANIRSFATSSPVDCIPLQCADMAVYETYRSWADLARGCPESAVDRPALSVFLRAKKLTMGGCFDDLALKRAVESYHVETGVILPREPGA